MLNDNKLDFIIIGAQKSGTTSLFKYVEQHPEIYIPKAKEVPFFSDDERYSYGIEWLIDNFYHNKASDSQLLGKATPQYMCDYLAPSRIYEHNPEIKLIALLRNPVERVVSHYKMCLKRQLESRMIDEALEFSLITENLEIARKARPSPDNETMCYISWSEYGRILNNYLNYFVNNQILVLSSQELIDQPYLCLNKVFSFLGINPDYTPSNIGKKYHVGGTERKVNFVYDNSSIKRIWKVLPFSFRRSFIYWFEQWNTVTNTNADNEIILSDDISAKLQQHFENDADILDEKFHFSFK